MQRSSDMIGYGLRAQDGHIGKIDDLLFDDTHFGLRWVVVDTGNWLPGRKVLLPPSAFDTPDIALQEYPVALTREQIEAAPDIDTQKPVSRQLESEIYGHYGWNPYWYGGFGYATAGGLIPAGTIPAEPISAPDDQPGAPDSDVERGDPHLRSVNEVTGYYIEATDGSIGHVEDFIIDEKDWAMRYLIVDTKNWWPGKKVLISPHWLRDIVWSDEKVFLDLPRDKIQAAPEFDRSITLDRAYEERIYRHYGLSPYWAG